MLTSSGRTALAVGVVALACGVLAGWPSVLLVGLVAVAATVAAVAMVRTAPVLEANRVLRPDRVTRGDTATSELTVHSAAGRRLGAVQVFDRVEGQLVELDVHSGGPVVSRRIDHALPTSRRGVIEVGPVVVRRSDPLALARSDQQAGAAALLWVHPRRHHVPPVPAHLLRSLEGPSSDTSPQGTLTFHSLRGYVRGDELRHIHWRSSARTGTLMVRQLVDTSLPDLTVVLDRFAGRWTDDRFEDAVEVAASILEACTRSRFPCRLVYSSGEVHEPTDGPAATRLLDHLTEARPHELDGLGRTIEHLTRAGRGTACVVVTGDAPTARLAGVANLRRRFAEVVVVTVRLAGRPPLALGGVTIIDVPSSAAFAAAWSASAPAERRA